MLDALPAVVARHPEVLTPSPAAPTRNSRRKGEEYRLIASAASSTSASTKHVQLDD